MYEMLKKTSRVLAVLSIAAMFLAASGANARERAKATERTMAPAGVAVNEVLGMDVRTQDGEEVASIEDVIVSQQGEVREVVLEYEGDMVAVPIQDLRFNQDHAVYMGTRSDLDAARDYYVYGSGPYVYTRGYRDTSRGAGVREDYGPRYQESVPRRGMTGWMPYAPYRSGGFDEKGYYTESRRGSYSGPGATPPRGYTGYRPYHERGTAAENEFGMAEEHVDRGYDRGYYEERERRAEEVSPRGLTGHMPYSTQQGPQGRFGLD